MSNFSTNLPQHDQSTSQRRRATMRGVTFVGAMLLCGSFPTAVRAFSTSRTPLATNPFGLRTLPTPSRTSRHVFSQRRSDDSAAATANAGPLTKNNRGVVEDSASPPLLPFLQQERVPAVPSSSSESTSSTELDTQSLLYGAAALAVTGGLVTFNSLGLTVNDSVHFIEALKANPQETLQGVLDSVQNMGPAGVVYFGIIYLVAEILCVPATPLTMSAGYLFGLTQGAGVCLLAAAMAASVSFVVGKTLLRSTVEGMLEENPKFRKLDEAVGREGFKLLLLVRLSPIFPFALSNYLYGASSIDFASYFFGTLIGFMPGTIAYVYTGMVGQALTVGEGAQPWYIYAAGFAGLLTFLKLTTDVASGIVESIEDE